MKDFKYPYYILEGRDIKKVSIEEFALSYEGERRGNRIIKQERFGCVFVSTIFLGIDHSFSFKPDAKPVLFETMIFGGVEDDYQDRCCTYDEALIMHEIAVKRAKRMIVLSHLIYPYQYVVKKIDKIRYGMLTKRFLKKNKNS